MTRVVFVSWILLLCWNGGSWTNGPPFVVNATPSSWSTVPSQQHCTDPSPEDDSSCRTTTTTTATHRPTSPPPTRIPNVLQAMNDPTNFYFLQELVSQKSVTDVTYSYSISSPQEENDVNDDNDSYSSRSKDHHPPTTTTTNNDIMIPPPSTTTTTSCEYTGHLWFLPKSKGIRFREKVYIVTLPSTSSSSSSSTSSSSSSTLPMTNPPNNHKAIACQTSYHDGTKWIDCSKVTCQFRSSQEDQEDHGGDTPSSTPVPPLTLLVHTELLLNLPFPKFAIQKIRRKIGSVFQTAVESFLEKYPV
mmetsp:Transcript_27862/g.42664  ORF Transcript_27862/g.42664 Transcript_27862/m.42664 type:complete len:303 (+) Transcript_27862:644-1552(+)